MYINRKLGLKKSKISWPLNLNKNLYNPPPLVHMRGDEDKPLSLLEIIWNSKDYSGPEGSHMQIKNVAAN